MHVVALLITGVACAVTSSSAPGDWVAIHQVLNTYPLAIDGKDFALLSQVFTEDVVANYGTGLGVLQGLSAVEAGLQERCANASTQAFIGALRY